MSTMSEKTVVNTRNVLYFTLVFAIVGVISAIPTLFALNQHGYVAIGAAGGGFLTLAIGAFIHRYADEWVDDTEERKQYAIEAEPTTFTTNPERADGTPLVELVEETATGDGDEWYFTERDAAAMAETILDEVETDTEREAIADD